TITYQAQSPEDFYSRLLASGTPEWRAFDLAYISKAYKGSDKHLITSDIKDLLSRSFKSVIYFLIVYLSIFENYSVVYYTLCILFKLGAFLICLQKFIVLELML